MWCSKKKKSDFNYDDQGRAILGSAREMTDWVKLGFEEQDKRRSQDIPFYKNYIDLRNCVLYISYPIGSKEPKSQIFNLCDMAGIVPGIEKIEGDAMYLFEVTLDIYLDGAVLYGNFFHYVKFDGTVRMDDATVCSTFSCFKCFFAEYVFMQRIHLKGGFTYEQCEFKKGLVMHDAEVGSINSEFNNCVFKECLTLTGSSFMKQEYSNAIAIRNSTVENLNISMINTNGIPLYIKNTAIHGMKLHNLKFDAMLGFDSCELDGIITAVLDENSHNSQIQELMLYSCIIKAQFHIEHSDIEKLSFTFGKIEELGRLRISQCKVGEFLYGSSSVWGRMDVINNTINTMDMDESSVPGYLLFQGNKVETYADRQTIRLLKNEAKKVNDEVAAIQLYAKEMQSLLTDKSISFWDKVSLWLSKLFSKFGESWTRAFCVTIAFSVVLTLLMLGLGSRDYRYDISGEFIGIGAFVACLLDNINVFSIPMFRETIERYGLNVLGQVLYFMIKLVVAYGSYQFIVAFRKYGRR